MRETILRLSIPLLAASFLATFVAAAEPSATTQRAADEALALLVSGDDDMRQVALDAVRHGLRGEWFTLAVAERIPKLTPGGQTAALLALADRGDAASVPAATTLLASSQHADVRAAALGLIGRLGGAADVTTLVTALAAAGRECDAARRGLVEIDGPDAAAAIRAAAAAAAPGVQSQLIDVLADRRDRSALPLFVTAAAGDPAVRAAALRALARFGGPDELDAMIRSLLQSTGDGRTAADQAIVAVCTTSADAPRAAAALVKGFVAADAEAQRSLLPTLARVGGPQVMAIIDGMLADPARRQEGLDALSKWPDATIKDRLLDLFGKATDAREKDLLLGTLIRVAPLPNNSLSDGEKLDLLKKTMSLCQRNEDRARVLERANAIRTFDTFRFVAPYLDDPALAEPACRSVVELAHHQKLRDAHKAEFTKALDKVLGTTKNDELVERATRYKAGQTWERKKKG